MVCLFSKESRMQPLLFAYFHKMSIRLHLNEKMDSIIGKYQKGLASMIRENRTDKKKLREKYIDTALPNGREWKKSIFWRTEKSFA